jgi:hypothetical protein
MDFIALTHILLGFLLADRGNDNWLIKYDYPMDSGGIRVSKPRP